MSRTLNDLLTKYVGASLAKQQALSDLLSGGSWDLDLDRGQIDFGSGLAFPVQLLGTEGMRAQTWLWSWANTAGGFPSHVLTAAETLRALGAAEGIPELSQPELPLSDVNGHMLALIASGVCEADCYYRAPYEGGAAYLLLNDTPLGRGTPTELPRVVTVLTQAISLYDVDHRRMAESFLRGEGFQVADQGGTLSGIAPDRGSVSVTFDAQGRFTDARFVMGARDTPGNGGKGRWRWPWNPRN